jgi:hypothetical protein
LRLSTLISSPKDMVGTIVVSRRIGAVLLLAITVIEFISLYLTAIKKPLWYDELLTFHVSQLQPFSRLWEALRAGVDGMPPGYYILVRFANMLSGDHHVTLRLPSIFGYLLGMLGVYWFTQKKLSVTSGLIAVLLMALSPFRAYALEARSYSLVVGFLVIAAVFWQRIGEKRLMVPLFALFLTLAVASHPLAVVIIYCFSAAELTWIAVSGHNRVRWSVWISCLLGTSPFLISLPLLLHYRANFGSHFWAQPSWRMVVSTYSNYLGIDSIFVAFALILFFVLMIGDSLLRMVQQPEGMSQVRGFSPPEIILAGSFLFYPAMLVVLTKMFGSGYTPRYGWPGILGLVLGSVYLVKTTWLRFSSTYLLVALLITVAAQALWTPYAMAGAMNERWATLAQLSHRVPDIPVVIGDPRTYLEAANYAPPELRDRLVEVVDTESAVRLVGSDTPDKTNYLLAQFIPLRIADLVAFQATHQRFILRAGGPFDWFTQYLIEKGYHLNLLSESSQIYIVER